MAPYNTLNVKLSNSQLNNLKSAIKNGTVVTLNLSSNIMNDSNDKNNRLHKLLLTNTQYARLCKAFANKYLANIKITKTQLHKIGQSGHKTGFRLKGNVLQLLAKIVLIPLGLTAAASSTDTATQKDFYGSGTTALIVPNEKMNGIIKLVKSLEESGLLTKGVIEAIQNEAKEQKCYEVLVY